MNSQTTPASTVMPMYFKQDLLKKVLPFAAGLAMFAEAGSTRRMQATMHLQASALQRANDIGGLL